ncbi:carbamoyl-phosphate synthase (glutamine-hydrolyzing) large subunit [Candidatus Woesearchaeota archaeon]|nr:carbamoyl-phosphate synthase (glutamine-hydrolyzing) large subunit [Candidatus Woesearchaeota archaeon]
MAEPPRKVLLLGSGALRIGQSGEFDYSGSQCLKALREEGIATILVNPNIATIQTSEDLANRIYFLPITPEIVEKIIEKERPDGILLSFGGQTALNCGLALAKAGVFQKWNVHVLGTPLEAIEATEDRELFVKKLQEINVKTSHSKAARNIEEARSFANDIGFPLMLRAGFALGGQGSGVAHDETELHFLLKQAFAYAPQVLLEEYLEGWKEIEYEVVRDHADNCITVCNMENLDPLGIHTGESIVVAPSQTLTDEEYHSLRRISIQVIRHLGIIGECNIQFALHPQLPEYRVIEVNARLSRSSALASKATGYPLAFIAAKLALGKTLPSLGNAITKITTACFEPALDYIVLKFPRWDLDKFKEVSKHIGTEMKSVGEVMAIGRTFEEVLQKAVRMLEVNMVGVVGNDLSFTQVREAIMYPTDKRLFAIVHALEKGISIDQIAQWSHINKWFLYKIENIVAFSRLLQIQKLTPDLLRRAKQLGFSDYQIAKYTGMQEDEVRSLRKHRGIIPYIKQIDTLAAEYPAKTNYLYLTYQGSEHDLTQEELSKKNITSPSIIVLGSGAYRIGSSVEFDWSAVNAVQTARTLGYSTVMINYNPETVSTDYDCCDRLYFDELSFERLQDIYEFENPKGIILSVGGQIPNNLALQCHEKNLRVLGTSPVEIDRAENRQKFSQLLDTLHIPQPEWQEMDTLEEIKKFAKRVEFPVLIRPSYVLSGAAMNVVFSDEDLEKYLKDAILLSPKYPVIVSKFETHSKEIEIDAVANKGEVILYAISEHIEHAGVHSGDATVVFPAQKTYLETTRKIKRIAKLLARALTITGPFNIQFLAKNNEVKVIECNLRASRSFPFVSKVFRQNLIDLATRSMLGEHIPPLDKSALDLDYVGVKVPQFSYSRLKGTDPVPSVEMASTGEVACLGEDLYEAFLNALLSTGFTIPQKNILISIPYDENRFLFLEQVKKLHDLGYILYGTEDTTRFYNRFGIPMYMLYKVHEEKKPNISDFIMTKQIDLIICIPGKYSIVERGDKYVIRRLAVDHNVSLINNIQVASLFVDALAQKRRSPQVIKAWDEY